MSQSQYRGKALRSIGKDIRLSKEGSVTVVLSFVLILMGSVLCRFDLLTLGIFIGSILAFDSLLLVMATVGSMCTVKRELAPSKIILGSSGIFKVTATIKGLKFLKACLVDTLPKNVKVKGSVRAEGSRIIKLEYEIKPIYRGPHEIGPVKLFVSSPLKFLYVDYRFPPGLEIDFDSVSAFYAESVKAPPVFARKALPGGHEIKVSGGYGEFTKLREYMPGDDIRLIHWPSTARNPRGIPIVKELMIESTVEVFVVVDPSMDTYFEYVRGRRVIDDLVDAAGGVIMLAMEMGDPVGIYLAGATVFALPPTRRRDYVYSAMKSLERLTPSQITRLRELPSVAGRILKRGTEVLILSTLTSLKPREVYEVVSSLRALRMKPFIIAPNMVKYVRYRFNKEVLAMMNEALSSELRRQKTVKKAVTSAGGMMYLAPPVVYRHMVLHVYMGGRIAAKAKTL